MGLSLWMKKSDELLVYALSVVDSAKTNPRKNFVRDDDDPFFQNFSLPFISSFFPSSALEHTFYVPSPPTSFFLLSFLLFYFFLTPIAIWCVFFLYLIFVPSLDFFTAFLSSLHRRLIILCQNHIVLMSPSIDDSSPFSRLILFPLSFSLACFQKIFSITCPLSSVFKGSHNSDAAHFSHFSHSSLDLSFLFTNLPRLPFFFMPFIRKNL